MLVDALLCLCATFASKTRLYCLQALHQDEVSKLEGQIVKADEAAAGKQELIKQLENSIAEVNSKVTELQDQASAQDVTIGMLAIQFPTSAMLDSMEVSVRFAGMQHKVICCCLVQ